MKNAICTRAGIAGSVIAALFDVWDAALITLIIFMGVDYATGLLVAGVFHNSEKTKNGDLESRAGWKGLCRKGVTLLIVLVACRLDLVMGSNFDNGGKFADVERLERSALTKGKRTKVYYYHPYSSYERGSNENENKIIRRHFPKGTDFGKVTAAEVKRAESCIANYPRKILDWKTSETIFRAAIAAL